MRTSAEATPRSPDTRRLGSPPAAPWLLPIIVGTALFSAGPFLSVIGLAMTRWNLLDDPRWVGGENLLRVITGNAFWGAAAVTVGLMLIIVPGQLVVGVALAKALTARVRGVASTYAVFLVPWTLAPLTVGVIARWFFSPSDGVVAAVAGRRIDAVVDPALAPLVVAVVVVWQVAGFIALVYASALGAIPEELRAAAALDGAGMLRTFLFIEVPLLRRTTLFLTVTGIVQCFGLYDVIVALTGGGPGTATTTLSYLIVRTAWEQFDIGEAAAIAVGTTGLLLGIVGIVFYLLRGESR